jgi:hypothetical protein
MEKNNIMKKVIRLTENKLYQIIKRTIMENDYDFDLEDDVKILHKLLNRQVFLGKMPGVSHVGVREYNNTINILLTYKKGVDGDEVRENSLYSIFDAVRMSGVDPNNIVIL